MKRFGLIVMLLITTVWHLLAIQYVRLSEDAEVSLLTCSPGTAVYSRFGHSAIRVNDPVNKIDYTFNYGVFQFDSDDFYLKFIKGETYYQLDVESTDWFVYSSSLIGRTTYEQVLNLTLNQKQQIFDSLLVNYEPKNRFYLYNFVFDNCATRPYYWLKTVVPEFTQVVENTPPSMWSAFDVVTFRQIISYYCPTNTWAGAGIDFVFGADADQLAIGESRLFLPAQLMRLVKVAEYADGTPICKSDNTEPFVVEKPTYWFTPNMCIILIVLIIIFSTFLDIKHTKCFWIPDIFFLFAGGLLGTIACYLSFFSIHPLVGHNYNIIIFNPLLFVFAIVLAFPVTQKWCKQHILIIGIVFTLIALLRVPLIALQTWNWLMIIPIVHGLRFITLGISYKLDGKEKIIKLQLATKQKKIKQKKHKR